MKSLLLLALGLARTVVLGARIEAERIVVSVRPYKREQRRCPVCGRACGFYDMASRGAPRLWRAMDLARSACYLEYAPCRVRCPEHGVRTEAVPWARHGARFTRDFEDWVAWLAVYRTFVYVRKHIVHCLVFKEHFLLASKVSLYILT